MRLIKLGKMIKLAVKYISLTFLMLKVKFIPYFS